MNLLHSAHENRPKWSRAGSAHVVPADWCTAADGCTSGSLRRVQTEVTDVRSIKKRAVCNQHCKTQHNWLNVSGKRGGLQFSVSRFISFKVTVYKTCRWRKQFSKSPVWTRVSEDCPLAKLCVNLINKHCYVSAVQVSKLMQQPSSARMHNSSLSFTHFLALTRRQTLSPPYRLSRFPKNGNQITHQRSPVTYILTLFQEHRRVTSWFGSHSSRLIGLSGESQRKIQRGYRRCQSDQRAVFLLWFIPGSGL